MENNFFELKEAIEKAENIVIFSHVNPDGDTLGSNLALNLMICKYFKKNVKSVYVGTLPEVYKYLPEYSSFCDAKTISSCDLAIAVDVASKDRLVYSQDLFNYAKIKVNIDHHKTNNGYADINIIEPYAACVGVILFKIFSAWNLSISKDTARCLYTSVMTDTGNFKYENTTYEVFKIAAELVKLGVSPLNEYRACYETKPQNMIQFQSFILSKSKFYNKGKIALAEISQADMQKYKAKDDFTEGIVEVLRTSQDVEIAGILKETKDGYTKVSLRSKKIDLTSIVTEFGGGGHTFAAGCTIKKPLVTAYNKLLERIQSEL